LFTTGGAPEPPLHAASRANRALWVHGSFTLGTIEYLDEDGKVTRRSTATSAAEAYRRGA
jgi:hypothetical protein